MPSQNALPERQAVVGRFNSHITEDSELKVLEDDEELVWGIEPVELADSSGWIDVLCLETACFGVLTTLWCELTRYAEDYAVPKAALRAMIQCAFLAELDKARFWAEVPEDPEPLTREKYLRVLERTRKAEDVRIQNARQRFRVPDEKWRELLTKAKAGRLSGVTNGQSDRQGG